MTEPHTGTGAEDGRNHDDSAVDARLSGLFAAAAARELPEEPFLTNVMRQADRRRRRALMARIAGGLLLALLAVPLQDPLELMTEYLLLPLVDAESPLGRVLFSPLSSVGAMLSIGLLALQFLYRRLFR